MSPPMAAPLSTHQMHPPNCPSSQNLDSLESLNFSPGSVDAARFGKSNPSSRSRPRLIKVRRKLSGASSKTDSGLYQNGLGGDVILDKNFDNVFGGNNGSSESSVGAQKVDLHGSADQIRSSDNGGLGDERNIRDSKFVKENLCFHSTMNSSKSCSCEESGAFSFGSSKGSSNSGAHTQQAAVAFGACKTASEINRGVGDLFCPQKNKFAGNANSANANSSEVGGKEADGCNGCKDGLNSYSKMKESSGGLKQQKENAFCSYDKFDFVFGSNEYNSTSNSKLGQKNSNKSGLYSCADGFSKVNRVSFVFGSNNASGNNLDAVKQDFGKYRDEDESCKHTGNTLPDMRGKVKLDADSEKVCQPCFKFSSDSSNCCKDSSNFLFSSNQNDSKSGINLENDSISKSANMSKSTNCAKEKAGIEMEFQNACFSDFTFGGSKGNVASNSGTSSMLGNEMGQLNGGKVEKIYDFRDHKCNVGSDFNNGFKASTSSGGAFENNPVPSLSDEMKGLSMDSPEAKDGKTQNFTRKLSSNTSEIFVFESNQENSDSPKENHPTNVSPNVSHFSQNNSESNRTTSFFSSVENGIQLDGNFCQVPSGNKEEKDEMSFTSKAGRSDSSDAGYSTLDLQFCFSSYDLFPSVKKMDSANSKSLRGKRLGKNGKLRRKPLVQQLDGQDQPFKEGSSQQSHKSPGYGSPMEYSPNHDASSAYTEVKGEHLASNDHKTGENCEKANGDGSNSYFSPLLPAQEGVWSRRQQYKKKYKLKVGPSQTQSNNTEQEKDKQGPKETTSYDVCEHWRIRGNEAYNAGKLSKAEEFYSNGINSVPFPTAVGYPMQPLLLCYSNRAATRLSVGRMREAISDCTKAASLDPSFLKVTLRAGNCYLVLGDVEDAIRCYNKCLGSGGGVCLDRRITIEAADGLQKAKKVAECLLQSTVLLQEGTENAASKALDSISEALSISCYSEKLLEMKGEALCILRMYDKAIQLCEQSLQTAKKNFLADHLDDPPCKSSHVSLWRQRLQIKSLYHLGRLDMALDLIEQQEKMPIRSKSGDMTQESSNALAATIQELLCLKRTGNEAFRSGNYAESIEHYTAAISKSIESPRFMAICFCNRAAAYQSTGQIIDAIADCSLAIALDESYLKAISRRATLHEMIRDYKHAVYDLQIMISLLESPSQAKTQQHDSQSTSSGGSRGSVRDIRKARRRLSTMEDNSKGEIPLNFYLILGVKVSDTESDIKKAYRKAALRHHPDKVGQVLVRSDGDDGKLWKEVGDKIREDADRLFKIIGEAYGELSDPSKRSKYDEEEEMRNALNNNRNSNSGRPSTSYGSPHGRGNWYGRQGGFGSASERNNNRRHWHDSRSYGDSYTRW